MSSEYVNHSLELSLIVSLALVHILVIQTEDWFLPPLLTQRQSAPETGNQSLIGARAGFSADITAHTMHNI